MCPRLWLRSACSLACLLLPFLCSLPPCTSPSHLLDDACSSRTFMAFCCSGHLSSRVKSRHYAVSSLPASNSCNAYMLSNHRQWLDCIAKPGSKMWRREVGTHCRIIHTLSLVAPVTLGCSPLVSMVLPHNYSVQATRQADAAKPCSMWKRGQECREKLQMLTF